VIEGWLPSTNAQEVLIANDELADDELQTLIMESAVPNAIRLIVDKVERIASLLLDDHDPDVRRMILVDDPEDALRLMRAGVDFTLLNLGNFQEQEFTISLSNSVMVGRNALSALCSMAHEGIVVTIQAVPFEKPVDFRELCSHRSSSPLAGLEI
jgi:mannose/fructose/N-acetylgalactosamine-specific phosphotransferase system component IIB